MHSPGRDILSFSSRGLYKKVKNIGMASVLHTLEEGGRSPPIGPTCGLEEGRSSQKGP